MVLFSLVATNTYALIYCDYGDRDESEIASVINDHKAECENYGGGGSKFYGSYSKVAKCSDSYGGEYVTSDDGYWQIVVGCNTCESKEIVVEVEDFKNACAEKCMLTDYQCVWQNGEWGGSLGAFPKVCSKVDRTATGCKEEPESSSSVQSSSSSAAESSSSGEGGDTSSSSSHGSGEGFSGSGGSGSDGGVANPTVGADSLVYPTKFCDAFSEFPEEDFNKERL